MLLPTWHCSTMGIKQICYSGVQEGCTSFTCGETSEEECVRRKVWGGMSEEPLFWVTSLFLCWMLQLPTEEPQKWHSLLRCGVTLVFDWSDTSYEGHLGTLEDKFETKAKYCNSETAGGKLGAQNNCRIFLIEHSMRFSFCVGAATLLSFLARIIDGLGWNNAEIL